MNKARETLSTIAEASRYSFQFCWRNGRGLAVNRLVVTFLTTLLIYVGVQMLGTITNEAQVALGNGKNNTLGQFLTGDLMPTIIAFTIVVIVGSVLGCRNEYLRNRWRRELVFAGQREVNEHRASLDVAKFKSKEFDEMERRIQELPYGWQTRSVFAEDLVGLFSTAVSFVLFASVLFQHNPLYIAFLVVFAIPMIVVNLRLTSQVWELDQSLVDHHKKRSVLEQAFRHDDTFEQAQMFNQMPELQRLIDLNVKHILVAREKLQRVRLKQESVTNALADLGLGLVTAYAVWMTVTGNIGLGTLTVIIASAKTFQGNLESVFSIIASQWNSAKGVVMIEREFFTIKPSIVTEYPVTPNFDGPPPIEFQNVGFTYPGADKPAIDEISFRIEPGTKVAIVGPSGSGKTTIADLINRFYDPVSGKIIVGNGTNLRNIDPREWHKYATALNQGYVILDRQIGEEIASSRLDKPLDIVRLEKAASFAAFDFVVTEKGGFSTQLGIQFGGTDLSGGERQRLAIARVIYAGTPIIILDEFDASLDPESASKITDQIFALKGVTVILITHHVSRAEDCDQIIVMNKDKNRIGRVVETGTHQELIARGGLYTSLYSKDKERLGRQSSPGSD